jgi:hypothetical protein
MSDERFSQEPSVAIDLSRRKDGPRRALRDSLHDVRGIAAP